MSNLSLLLGLEPLKKFVVGGGWVVESDFSVKLQTQALKFHLGFHLYFLPMNFSGPVQW